MTQFPRPTSSPPNTPRSHSWFYMPLLLNGMMLKDSDDVPSRYYPNIDTEPEKYTDEFKLIVKKFREKYFSLEPETMMRIRQQFINSMDGEGTDTRGNHIQGKVQERIIDEVMDQSSGELDVELGNRLIVLGYDAPDSHKMMAELLRMTISQSPEPPPPQAPAPPPVPPPPANRAGLQNLIDIQKDTMWNILEELTSNGKKITHWAWYVFPTEQVGRNDRFKTSVRNADEAHILLEQGPSDIWELVLQQISFLKAQNNDSLRGILSDQDFGRVGAFIDFWKEIPASVRPEWMSNMFLDSLETGYRGGKLGKKSRKTKKRSKSRKRRKSRRKIRKC